tara:strand:- start:481 stop:681 length:201 start_codon:yes stop_codon:yes gene_type:complete
MTLSLSLNDSTLTLSLRSFATGTRLRVNRGGNVSTYRATDAADITAALAGTAGLWAVVPFLLACSA